MAKGNTVNCPLMQTKICAGLCAEIMAVSSGMLKMEAVPEISEYSLVQIEKACDGCPYLN